jgi:hypothetical protein
VARREGEANRGRMTTAPPPPPDDALFAQVLRLHGDLPWGRVLDAGTGAHSLSWLMQRPTEGWVAVTGGEGRKTELLQSHGVSIRPVDQIVVGNWQDPTLLYGEQFDVILADYLLGAIEGWAPFFQDQLFGRLVRHLRPGGRLYGIGLEPFPEGDLDEGGRIIWEIARLRDACILLAGHRCYREYPRVWVERAMEAAGLRLIDSKDMPIRFRRRFIDGQLDVCVRKLPYIRDLSLRASLRNHIEALRSRARAVEEARGGICFGSDWVVAAELPRG